MNNWVTKMHRILNGKTIAGADAQKAITDLLESDKPAMIARFGANEIKGMMYGKYYPLLKPIKNKIFIHMRDNAGFSPIDDISVKKFSNLMEEDLKCLDILASWRPEEFFYRKYLKNAKKIKLGCLDDFYEQPFWTSALKSKSVLVVHPFKDSIEKGYENRKMIWKNLDVLPEFGEFQVIKAVQSLGAENGNWFENLEQMKAHIDSARFDVALIGCGAYGFPLAAHCKKMGKKAVHGGGGLQLFFGIKGKRWGERNYMNEYWQNPSESETPKNFKKVEGGCYW